MTRGFLQALWCTTCWEWREGCSPYSLRRSGSDDIARTASRARGEDIVPPGDHHSIAYRVERSRDRPVGGRSFVKIRRAHRRFVAGARSRAFASDRPLVINAVDEEYGRSEW